MTPRQWQLTTAGVCVAVAVLLQFTVLARLPFAAPSLVTAAVIGVAMACGRTAGPVAGFCAGLALDVLPPADGLVGASALALVVVGYLAGRVRDPRGLAPLQLLAVVAGLAMLAGAGQWLLATILSAGAPGPGQVLPALLISSVLTGIVGLAVVPGIGAAVRRAGGTERRRRRPRAVIG